MTVATQIGKQAKKEVLEGFLLTCERPNSRGRLKPFGLNYM